MSKGHPYACLPKSPMIFQENSSSLPILFVRVPCYKCLQDGHSLKLTAKAPENGWLEEEFSGSIRPIGFREGFTEGN